MSAESAAPAAAAAPAPAADASAPIAEPKSLFELSALDSKKKRLDFSQYKGLETLYKEHVDQGLVILGFPCNGFGSQEPGSEAEIESFCSLNYGVSFPIMAKIEVNGDNEHPVYKFLKSQKSGVLGLKRIKWNFEKFLVNKQGQVVERYSSLTKPEDIKAKIEELLKE